MDKITNCLILHGCPSAKDLIKGQGISPHEEHWLPWLKAELIKHGIDAETPHMPQPLTPNYEKYKQEFEKYHIDQNTVLVGHSCASAFLVRWLGESRRSIRKLILVAPWKVAEPNVSPEEYEYYTYPVDKRISSRVGEIIIFTSDNEKPEGKESMKILHRALGGRVISIAGWGHYTMRDMGQTDFPELLKAVMEPPKMSLFRTVIRLVAKIWRI
jgi:predicted alpha/beta hydrolase family esterase